MLPRDCPGTYSLLTLLAKYWEAIEADLLRYYQVDLLDLWRGTLSLRRIRVLIYNLPAGSVFGQIRGGETYWSQETRAIMLGTWSINSTLAGLMGGKKAKKIPPPEPPQVGWLEEDNQQDDLNHKRLKAWQERQNATN